MIVKVALLLEDGRLFIGAKGRRHDNLYKHNGEDFFAGIQNIQGFVDEQGKFYTRKEAAIHAFECGQVKEKWDSIVSEDLW